MGIRGRRITTVTTVITTRGRRNMSQAKMFTPTLLLLSQQRSLSPTMSRLWPTTLLVAMDTTSTVLATHTLTGAPRVFTKGKLRPLSPIMSLRLPTTQLVAMDTTSMAQATRTSTGALRVFTRGMPLAAATSTWTVMTAMGTTARTQSMESRSTAMTRMSTRTEDTEALSGHAK